MVGPVLDVFIAKHQRPLCIDIEVSPVHNIAWMRMSRRVPQQARQSSEFAPDTDGIDNTVFRNGGSVVAHAQPEDLDLCIGRPVAFHPNITSPPPSDRLNPVQPDSARLGISGDQPSSHHQCPAKTDRNRVKFSLVKDVGVRSALAKDIRTSPR